MIDGTPWPDVLDLLSYWRVSPPVHVLVRAYMGIGKTEKPMEEPTEDALLAAMTGF